MHAICSICNICSLPEQESPRVYAMGEENSKILVIDDLRYQNYIIEAFYTAQFLLGTPDFCYTSTIRCNTEYVTPKEFTALYSRCSVWTNSLVENRSLIISTKNGLDQMKVGVDKGEGDAFRVTRLGVILCTPPLHSLDEDALIIYREKVKRVMKEAGV